MLVINKEHCLTLRLFVPFYVLGRVLIPSFQLYPLPDASRYSFLPSSSFRLHLLVSSLSSDRNDRPIDTPYSA